MSHRVLIVDDDANQRQLLVGSLRGQGYETFEAKDGAEALAAAEAFLPEVILTDLHMPKVDGFELLKSLKQHQIDVPVIVLTGYGSAEKAVEMVHELGVFWFLEKPVKVRVIQTLVERALTQGHLQSESLRLNRELSQSGVLGNLVGSSEAMQRIFSLIRMSAPSSAAVFITGESGTGKEMVAREIHRLSQRATGPFVAINCASLPETLIESELFGHEKGAFTGAVERRAGCFEQAHSGTIFLDEIGEMPIATQSKLLRVLEDMKVRRLGAAKDIQVDTRFISATNRSPEQAIEQKELREDLFYRLNVFRLELPPLRKRIEDIPAIAESMIHRLNARHGTRVTNLSPEAISLMLRHHWPGNVRELRNTVERAVILTQQGVILPASIASGLSNGPRKSTTFPGETLLPASGTNLPFSPLAAAKANESLIPASSATTGDPCYINFALGLTLAEVESAYILATLRNCNENRRLAASVLGISLRTLQTRIVEMRARASSVAAASSAPVEGEA